MRVRNGRRDDELRIGSEELLGCYNEEMCVAHLVYMIREATVKGQPLEIDFEACARMAVALQDPYDEEGESRWHRIGFDDTQNEGR